MKRSLLLVIVVCLFLQTIAFFIPGVYVEENYVPETVQKIYDTPWGPEIREYEISKHSYDVFINVFMIDDTLAVIMGILVIAVTLAAAIVALFVLLKKFHQKSPPYDGSADGFDRTTGGRCNLYSRRVS